ncbi:sodium/hydrogen exchanger [Methanohalobium evestigatum Z-7303]|uniref:Sodium/hydrogen exchanger n=1 Tax=Methanohalobium evestigatum (strain ATCC BAA-1072 / DSM 3721 / NBRC 107634 / OCM 161 / Z-7303) TaxID=644295 RepID=D7EAI5_METEZ|nr:cation:proton antiporter [Methanohalobium evestigatum]ADI74984.1 sodium/hydrogen exchanger [Methanohalobium evestigatum Z-7303]
MDTILIIFVILFLAKVLGEFFERTGFSSILGEIFAGIILSMFLLSHDPETFSFLAELGAIFLLFTAGYKEVHLQELRSASKKAIIPTITQIVLAFSSGFILGLIFNFQILESLFMAVAFSATSIGVLVKILIDYNYLSSKPGSLMLTSAIFDDIAGIFMLSIVVTVAELQHLPSFSQILTIFAKLAFFMLSMVVLGLKIYPKLFDYIHKMHIKESIFSFVIIIALFSAYFAEAFELHAVIGAFVGGIILSRIPIAKIEDVQSKVSGLSYGIFTPIFFAYIGFTVDLSVLETTSLFTILVVVMALLGKLVGGFIGSKIVGLDSSDSLIFGIGVMPRAGIELVVITVGRNRGIIGDEIYSAIVLMVIVSIIVSPMLLKFAINAKEKSALTSSSNP